MNKRGISPLIATVLLVAFSIALAAMVSTYIIGKTKEFKPEAIIEDSLLCDNVALDYSVESTGINPLTLQALSGNLKKLTGLKLVNKGSFTIYKYTMNAPGVSTLNNIPLKGKNDAGGDVTNLKPGESLGFEIGLKVTADKLIKIIPIIQDPEKDKTYIKCTKSQLIFDYAKLCKDIYGDIHGVTNNYCPP